MAALTGDLVGDASLSSDADPLRRVKALKEALSLVEEVGGSDIVASFAIFRGDGAPGNRSALLRTDGGPHDPSGASRARDRDIGPRRRLTCGLPSESAMSFIPSGRT